MITFDLNNLFAGLYKIKFKLIEDKMKKLLFIMLLFPTLGIAQELLLFRSSDTTYYTTLQYTASSFMIKDYPVIIDSYNLKQPMQFRIIAQENTEGINSFSLVNEKKDTIYFNVYRDDKNELKGILKNTDLESDLFYKPIILSKQNVEFKNEFSDTEYESVLRMLTKNLELYKLLTDFGK